MSHDIREAQLSDAAELAVFAGQRFIDIFGHNYHPDDAKEFLAKYYSTQEFETYILDDDKFLRVAFDQDGKICGYAMAGAMKLPNVEFKPNSYELYRLYVSENTAGTGLGRALYDLVLEEARRINASEFYLGVWSLNARALKFYHKLGFEIVGKYLYQVGRTFDDERIMRLRTECLITS